MINGINAFGIQHHTHGSNQQINQVKSIPTINWIDLSGRNIPSHFAEAAKIAPAIGNRSLSLDESWEGLQISCRGDAVIESIVVDTCRFQMGGYLNDGRMK
jgi:hypothetical protein